MSQDETQISRPCYAQCLSPQNWENKICTAMQKHKGVYCLLELGPKSQPAQWNLDEGPELWITAAYIQAVFCLSNSVVGMWWLTQPWVIVVIDLTLASSGRTLVSSGTLVGLPRIMTHAYKNLRLRPSMPCWACHGSGQVPTSLNWVV